MIDSSFAVEVFACCECTFLATSAHATTRYYTIQVESASRSQLTVSNTSNSKRVYVLANSSSKYSLFSARAIHQIKSNKTRHIIQTSSMQTLTVDRHPEGLINPLDQKDWDTALTVILHSPHWTKRVSPMRGLPLHVAYREGAPIEVLTALLEAYPDATKSNASNSLPCHTACYYGTSSEGMKMLLRCNPDAMHTPIECMQLFFFAAEKEQVTNHLKQHPSYWKSKEQQALLQSAFEETDRRRSVRRSVARIVLGRRLILMTWSRSLSNIYEAGETY
jgi:ankyrin repeat protein